MTETDTVPFTSIAETSEALRHGRLSPTELTERCLRRIEALNPSLNAFITVTEERAREQAAEAGTEIRAGRWRGPLHGIPVAVKDFYDTAGVRTTAAFEPFRNRVPAEDAVVVTRLRDAGAVLVGKTNMHRLGMGTTSLESDFGPVVNPWSARHVAGGSSGGSAVAVAAALSFATVDTDAVGSGRLPAALCGVVCFKPSFGRLSTAGILAGEDADPAILLLSHGCVTARDAVDARLVYHALTDQALEGARSDEDEHGPVRRLGIVSNFIAIKEVSAVFETVLDGFRALGFDLGAATVPFERATFDLRAIDADRASIASELFAEHDAILLPTLTAPAPSVDEARARGEMAVAPDNTFFCNYFGLPAITVPCGVDANGVPLGLQIVGPPAADDAVLRLAAAYQEAMEGRFTAPWGSPS